MAPLTQDAAPARRAMWTVTGVVLGVQLAGLVAYSTYLFSRFDVAEDFAHNAQAWFLIGHGNLDPVDTVRVPSTLFLRDHFDLILWPLSVLRLLSSSSVTLLVVQDLAIVATEAITMMWVIRICEEYLDSWRLGAELTALGLLVANAWWYETASADIHLPPLGLPLAVLTGYLLWCGRFRWALVPAACCVLFGAVVVELLAFVGFGALLTRRVRDQGGTITAAAITIGSLVWVFIINGSGFDQASNITAEYSYLVGSTAPSGAVGILRGVVTHPWTALRALESRWRAIGRPLEMAGVLGLLTPSGALVALGVLVPAALAASPVYSSSAGAFQTLAVVPFVLVGTVTVLAQWWARAWHLGGRRRGRRVVIVLAGLLIAVALVQDGRLLAHLRSTWWRVSPSASSALGTVLTRTPPGAEVIASNGIIGRFSERRFVYPLSFAPQTFPVEAKDVIFVITPNQGNEAVPPVASQNDLSYVTTAIDTRTLLDRDGVFALEWRPSRGTRTVTLSGASSVVGPTRHADTVSTDCSRRMTNRLVGRRQPAACRSRAPHEPKTTAWLDSSPKAAQTGHYRSSVGLDGSTPARRSAFAFVRTRTLRGAMQTRSTIRATCSMRFSGSTTALTRWTAKASCAVSSRPPMVSSRATAPPTRSWSGP